MSEDKRIIFKGHEYLLIGGERDGAIATQEQYDNFEESFAYLNPDGKIMRYGQEIGTIDDIEFIKDPTP